MFDNTFLTVITDQSPRYSKYALEMDRFFLGPNIKKMTEKLKNLKVSKKVNVEKLDEQINYQQMKKM